MKKSVIHIGANKTASTTLQRSLFSHHSGLYYLGEDGADYKNYKEIVDSMVSDDDLHFPQNQCRDLFQRHTDSASGKTFIYSNEDMMTSRVPVLCAERLKAMLPDAQVLLVIRNQNTAIPSFYCNHGAFLKPAPPSYFRRHVSFDDWMSFQIMFPKYGALASFFYNRFASVYAGLFGAESLHILLFEEFVTNKDVFVEKLCRVLEIEFDEARRLLGERHERRRITSRMLAYNRFRTRFFWGVPFFAHIPGGQRLTDRFQRFLESGASAKTELTGAWRERLFELYAEENSVLASTYGLPLQDYDYPLA